MKANEHKSKSMKFVLNSMKDKSILKMCSFLTDWFANDFPGLIYLASPMPQFGVQHNITITCVISAVEGKCKQASSARSSQRSETETCRPSLLLLCLSANRKMPAP